MTRARLFDVGGRTGVVTQNVREPWMHQLVAGLRLIASWESGKTAYKTAVVGGRLGWSTAGERQMRFESDHRITVSVSDPHHVWR